MKTQNSRSHLKPLLLITLGGIITLSLACCFCIFLYNIGNSLTSPAASQTPESTSSKPLADVTFTPPSKSTFTPSEAVSPTSKTKNNTAACNVVQIAQDLFGSNLLNTKEYHSDGPHCWYDNRLCFPKQYAKIEYKLSPQQDEQSMVQTCFNDLIQVAHKIFTLTDIGVLELRSYTEFKDNNGNITIDVVMHFSLDRTHADQINWENVDKNLLLHMLNVTDVTKDSNVYVIPALQSAWYAYECDVEDYCTNGQGWSVTKSVSSTPLPLPTNTLTPSILFQTPTTVQYPSLLLMFIKIC